MNRRIAARGIAIDNQGQIFCVRLKAYDNNKERHFWCLPGGSVDRHETLCDAVTREIIEETGVLPTLGALLYVHQFVAGRAEHLEFMFHITNFSDYQDIDISKASHADKEIADFGFVDPKKKVILPRFLSTEDITHRIINQEPTKIFSFLLRTA
ncbi:NUDIX hydrolase [Candidatus Saccharibacteria bacterium]|nr:NUDIX hydrolase [Candidatus Saccharibacteria bacterium]